MFHEELPSLLSIQAIAYVDVKTIKKLILRPLKTALQLCGHENSVDIVFASTYEPRNCTSKIDRIGQKGAYVFTHADLSKIFAEGNPKTLQAGLNRLVKESFLARPVRGSTCLTSPAATFRHAGISRNAG